MTPCWEKKKKIKKFSFIFGGVCLSVVLGDKYLDHLNTIKWSECVCLLFTSVKSKLMHIMRHEIKFMLQNLYNYYQINMVWNLHLSHNNGISIIMTTCRSLIPPPPRLYLPCIFFSVTDFITIFNEHLCTEMGLLKLCFP